MPAKASAAIAVVTVRDWVVEEVLRKANGAGNLEQAVGRFEDVLPTMSRHGADTAPRLAAFSFINIAAGGFNVPLLTYLPAFYATTVGMDLSTVGIVFMVSRLWSVVADPLIGWASDSTRTRWGRRKPWVLGGGILFLISLTAVFFPPAGAGPLYLGCWLLLLCVGWTATSTPLYAWGAQLSASSAGRARVQAYLHTAMAIGVFVVLVLPAILDALRLGNPEARLSSMGGLIAILLTIGLLLITFLFREIPSAEPAGPAPPQWQAIGAVLRDGTLARIIASDFFVALGQGFRGALFLFFVTRYMGLASPAMLLILQFALGIAAAPIWVRISYRLGRARTLILAEAVQTVIYLLLLLVTPSSLPLFVVLLAAQGLTQGSGNLMLRSMIYDVADRHRQENGIERAGLFSSMFNMTTNAASSLAVGIALPAVVMFGFDPRSAGGEGVRSLQMLFALGPALGHLLSIAFILRLARAERA